MVGEPALNRSLKAVLFGTFTLRFSTGLTGGLLVFYLANLQDHGGVEVDAVTFAFLYAAFYATELVLSPVFGLLSDRLGHHRVMQWGPIFGAVAVTITGLTTNLLLLGGTRVLEGAATAASVPSILGFIAMATMNDEGLRGQTSARFELATIAGIGAGTLAATLLYPLMGSLAFFLNAADLRRVVPDLPIRRECARRTRRAHSRARVRLAPLRQPAADVAHLAAGADLDSRQRRPRRVRRPGPVQPRAREEPTGSSTSSWPAV